MRVWMDYWPKPESKRRGEYARHEDFFLLLKDETDWTLLWCLRLSRTVLMSRLTFKVLDKVA